MSVSSARNLPLFGFSQLYTGTTMGGIFGAVVESTMVVIKGDKSRYHADVEAVKLAPFPQRNKVLAGRAGPGSIVWAGAHVNVQGTPVVVVERREEEVRMSSAQISAIGVVVNIDVQAVLKVVLQ